MNTDKEMDLKKEGDDTQDDSGQPSKDSSKDLKGDISLPDDGQSEKEQFVKLSKSEYEKLREERNNYREGLLSTKEKLKQMEEKQSPEKEENTSTEPSGDYLTKSEFKKMNEEKAIRKFLNENPDIKNNWGDLVQHYAGKRGKLDVDAIVQDLDDAKDLLYKHNPEIKKDKSPEKDDSKKSLLATDKSLSGQPPVRQEGTSKKKGGVLNTGDEKPENWYGGGEEE